MTGWQPIETVEGMSFLCELAPELGRVEAIKCSDGRWWVRTESGVDMILPPPPQDESK